MQGSTDAGKWLEAFCAGTGDAASLFAADALWRDYLAFQWDLQTHEGRHSLRSAMPVQPCIRSPDIEQIAPQEFIFEFDGPHGEGNFKALFESIEAQQIADGDLRPVVTD